jgi:hypothetical protein
MGRARVVAPPPQDYIPEPLVSPIIEIVLEEENTSWTDGSMEEEIVEVQNNEPSQEELEREKHAQEIYEELQKQKNIADEEAKAAIEILAKAKEILENPPVKIETVVETVIETIHITDPQLVEELQLLKTANERLTREKEAAEKVRDEIIVAARSKVTEQRINQHVTQLDMKQKTPSLMSKLKAFLRSRRIKKATTVGLQNYETAILERARITVPGMLDSIENMHEQMTILEDLLVKYNEVKSTQPSK